MFDDLGSSNESSSVRQPNSVNPGGSDERVLDVIRSNGPISRTGISRITGLSAATIGRVASRFLADEVLIEPRKHVSGIGRPSILLELNAKRASVIAIDLDGEHISVALADLTGEIVWQETSRTGSDSYDSIVTSLQTANNRAAAQLTPVAAVSLGVPAVIDQDNGLALAGPYVQWNEFELVRQLSRDITVPFIVDNDVNLAAIGHHWRGDASNVNDFAIFSIGTGTGGAAMSNGMLIRGHRNAAGEFGFMATDPATVMNGEVHTVGSLEQIVSGPGIASLTRALLAKSDGSSQLSRTAVIGSQETIAAATAGDSLALEVMDTVIRHLTVAIIGITCVTAPELIIIEGSVGRSLAPFLDELRQSVGRHVPSLPTIKVATMASKATLTGAISTGLALAWEHRLPDRLSTP